MASSERGAGLTLFAGVMMILVGAFQGFMGLFAILGDEIFVASPEYLLKLSTSSWGWVHMLLGILVALTGLALLAGQTWARVVGIFFAAVAAFSNFMFIPQHPVWSILLIILDVAVIWALCVYRAPEIN